MPSSGLNQASPSETLRPLQRIPSELWLEILGHIPRGDLANVNLTSRSFLPVSRTLQFEEFAFHPYGIDPSESIPRQLSQNDDEVDATIRRLEFWASESVAPLVRQISVSPWRGTPAGGNHLSADANRDHLVRDILGDAFFRELHHFVHLQNLDCFLLDFTQTALQHLCELPYLEGLTIERCSISASAAPSAPFRLAHLKYLDALSTHEQLEAAGVQRWLTFLDSSRLKSVTLISPRASAVFFRHISAIGIMTSLHTLVAGILMSLQQIVLIIRKTPALKKLYLSSLGASGSAYREQIRGISSPLSSHVPMLYEYTGPYDFLPFVLPGSHLRCLNLYGFDAYNCSDITSILESVRPFQGTMKHVKSLDLRLRGVSKPAFVALCSMFVSVQSFRLLMSDSDGSDFCEVRHIHLHYQRYSDKWDLNRPF
jgi:hypothetical protein